MSDIRTCPGIGGKPCGVGLRDRFLCRGCADRVVTTLAAIPGLLDELETTLAKQDRISRGGGTSGKPGSRPPINFEAMALLRLGHEIAVWACEIGYYSMGSLTIDAAIDAVSADPSRLQTRVDGPEFARFVSRSASRLRGAIDGGGEKQYIGRCSQCDAELLARKGQELVRCRACDTEHDVELSRAATTNALRDQLLPLDDIRRGLSAFQGTTVNRKTVHSWCRRGRLLPRGKNLAGVDLYRVGDYLELAEQLQQPDDDGKVTA